MKEITMKNNHEIHEDDAKNMETLKRYISMLMNPNSFDMEALKDQFHYDPWKEKNPYFREFFLKIINTRGIKVDEYNEIAEDDFPTEDSLYEYLKSVYSFVYEDGSEDAIDDAIERAGIL
jgi:hypothetical protein